MSELSCTTAGDKSRSFHSNPKAFNQIKYNTCSNMQKIFGPITIIMKTQLTLLAFLHISTTQQTYGKNKMAFS